MFPRDFVNRFIIKPTLSLRAVTHGEFWKWYKRAFVLLPNAICRNQSGAAPVASRIVIASVLYCDCLAIVSQKSRVCVIPNMYNRVILVTRQNIRLGVWIRVVSRPNVHTFARYSFGYLRFFYSRPKHRSRCDCTSSKANSEHAVYIHELVFRNAFRLVTRMSVKM